MPLKQCTALEYSRDTVCVTVWYSLPVPWMQRDTKYRSMQCAHASDTMYCYCSEIYRIQNTVWCNVHMPMIQRIAMEYGRGTVYDTMWYSLPMPMIHCTAVHATRQHCSFMPLIQYRKRTCIGYLFVNTIFTELMEMHCCFTLFCWCNPFCVAAVMLSHRRKKGSCWGKEVVWTGWKNDFYRGKKWLEKAKKDSPSGVVVVDNVLLQPVMQIQL